MWDLDNVDKAEIALRSVQHCSFEDILKKDWIGVNWDKKETLQHNNREYKIPHIDSNAWELNNVPPTRHHFRVTTMKLEFEYLFKLDTNYLESVHGKN